MMNLQQASALDMTNRDNSQLSMDSNQKTKQNTEIIQLQTDMIKCRSQLYESNYKLKALKDKFKKSQEDLKDSSDKVETTIKDKEDVILNYKLIVKKLNHRDQLISQRQLDIISHIRDQLAKKKTLSKEELAKIMSLEVNKLEACIQASQNSLTDSIVAEVVQNKKKKKAKNGS